MASLRRYQKWGKMAFTWSSRSTAFCLSTDTLPTTYPDDSPLPLGLTCTESDTGKSSVWNGNSWISPSFSTTSHTHSASQAFPINSVFISVVSTNPNTLLGYGTWSSIGAGRVLVGLDSTDVDFDVVEETGGAKTHTHASHSYTPGGTNSSGAVDAHSGTNVSVHSGTAIASHVFTQAANHVVTQPANHVVTQPNAHTDVINHTHPVTDPGHTHALTELRNATTGAASTNIAVTADTSSTLGTKPTGSQVTGLTTNNPVGGLASLVHSGTAVNAHSGTAVDAHSGAGVDAHVVTQPSNHVVTQPANHVFTQPNFAGTPATLTHDSPSHLMPYLVVYMWKRTA